MAFNRQEVEKVCHLLAVCPVSSLSYETRYGIKQTITQVNDVLNGKKLTMMKSH